MVGRFVLVLHHQLSPSQVHARLSRLAAAAASGRLAAALVSRLRILVLPPLAPAPLALPLGRRWRRLLCRRCCRRPLAARWQQPQPLRDHHLLPSQRRLGHLLPRPAEHDGCGLGQAVPGGQILHLPGGKAQRLQAQRAGHLLAGDESDKRGNGRLHLLEKSPVQH